MAQNNFKETIKILLQEWKEDELPQTIEREIDLAQYLNLKTPKIIAITGFRRGGKTYAVYQLIKELLKQKTKEEVVYINFEDERIPGKTEFLTELLPAIKEVYQKKTQFLFLDEIQNIPNWSKWVRRIYDHERSLKIFITGSSSKMSSREIPTELRGRCLEAEVFPLSFKEFLRFKNSSFNPETIPYSEKSRTKLNRLLKEYLLHGSMPEPTLSDPAKRHEILQQYYQTVIRKDIIERYKIKNEEGLKALILLLLNSTMYSQTKLYNTLKSLNYKIGKTTLSQYITFLENAYFLQSPPLFSPRVKDQLMYPRKIYFIDNGFINALSTKLSNNYGRLFENLIYRELKRSAEFDEEIFYWKDEKGKEVDFVVKKGLQVGKLVQACYDLSSDLDTEKREVQNLLKAGKELKCKNLILINQDIEKEKKVGGQKIQYLPLWKWLFAKDG